MVTRLNGDHLTVYTGIELQCCTSEANVYVNFTSIVIFQKPSSRSVYTHNVCSLWVHPCSWGWRRRPRAMLAVDTGYGDGREDLGSSECAQGLPGNAGNRIFFRNSYFHLGMTLRSCSLGQLWVYTMKWAGFWQHHKSLNTSGSSQLHPITRCCRFGCGEWEGKSII